MLEVAATAGVLTHTVYHRHGSTQVWSLEPSEVEGLEALRSGGAISYHSQCSLYQDSCLREAHEPG